MRFFLVSGGQFAGNVPKAQVTYRTFLGLTDTPMEHRPEIQFAFDDDVFKNVYDKACKA